MLTSHPVSLPSGEAWGNPTGGESGTSQGDPGRGRQWSRLLACRRLVSFSERQTGTTGTKDHGPRWSISTVTNNIQLTTATWNRQCGRVGTGVIPAAAAAASTVLWHWRFSWTETWCFFLFQTQWFCVSDSNCCLVTKVICDEFCSDTVRLSHTFYFPHTTSDMFLSVLKHM